MRVRVPLGAPTALPPLPRIEGCTPGRPCVESCPALREGGASRWRTPASCDVASGRRASSAVDPTQTVYAHSFEEKRNGVLCLRSSRAMRSGRNAAVPPRAIATVKRSDTSASGRRQRPPIEGHVGLSARAPPPGPVNSGDRRVPKRKVVSGLRCRLRPVGAPRHVDAGVHQILSRVSFN